MLIVERRKLTIPQSLFGEDSFQYRGREQARNKNEERNGAIRIPEREDSERRQTKKRLPRSWPVTMLFLQVAMAKRKRPWSPYGATLDASEDSRDEDSVGSVVNKLGDHCAFVE